MLNSPFSYNLNSSIAVRAKQQQQPAKSAGEAATTRVDAIGMIYQRTREGCAYLHIHFTIWMCYLK